MAAAKAEAVLKGEEAAAARAAVVVAERAVVEARDAGQGEWEGRVAAAVGAKEAELRRGHEEEVGDSSNNLWNERIDRHVHGLTGLSHPRIQQTQLSALKRDFQQRSKLAQELVTEKEARVKELGAKVEALEAEVRSDACMQDKDGRLCVC